MVWLNQRGALFLFYRPPSWVHLLPTALSISWLLSMWWNPSQASHTFIFVRVTTSTEVEWWKTKTRWSASENWCWNGFIRPMLLCCLAGWGAQIEYGWDRRSGLRRGNPNEHLVVGSTILAVMTHGRTGGRWTRRFLLCWGSWSVDGELWGALHKGHIEYWKIRQHTLCFYFSKTGSVRTPTRVIYISITLCWHY